MRKDRQHAIPLMTSIEHVTTKNGFYGTSSVTDGITDSVGSTTLARVAEMGKEDLRVELARAHSQLDESKTVNRVLQYQLDLSNELHGAEPHKDSLTMKGEREIAVELQRLQEKLSVAQKRNEVLQTQLQSANVGDKHSQYFIYLEW